MLTSKSTREKKEKSEGKRKKNKKKTKTIQPWSGIELKKLVLLFVRKFPKKNSKINKKKRSNI